MSRSDSSPKEEFLDEKQATLRPELHPADHIEQVHDVGKIARHDDIDAELDPRDVAHLTHKFDRYILPWLFGLWLFAYIDRSNIGNARIVGLADQLKLTQDKFNITLAVFYIPYICIDVPSNWFVKAIGAGYYLPALVIAWGIISMCIGFVTSYNGLIAARFFLGLAEGGLLGGMIIYLAMFYPRRQLARRVTYFYTAAPLSGAFGGLLATGLSRIKTTHYKGWPFIFFVEGAITIIFAAIAMIFLPHTPAHARFLSPEEQELAAQRMAHDASGATVTTDVKEERFDWHWVKLALLNWNTLLLSLNFFALITPIYSFSLFLPTIIKDLGYSDVHAQLLTVPPNVAGVITVPLFGYISDKVGKRGPIMLVGYSLALIGYIMLISSGRTLINYGGTFFVAAGIFPTSPLVMSWLANNLAPHYVRATGAGFQIMIANMVSFLMRRRVQYPALMTKIRPHSLPHSHTSPLMRPDT